MTADEQLARWVAGDPVHRGSKGEGECCPDFSCCHAEFLQPEEVRNAFAAADEAGRQKFLFAFLGAAIASTGKQVYIAGKGPNES